VRFLEFGKHLEQAVNPPLGTASFPLPRVAQRVGLQATPHDAFQGRAALVFGNNVFLLLLHICLKLLISGQAPVRLIENMKNAKQVKIKAGDKIIWNNGMFSEQVVIMKNSLCVKIGVAEKPLAVSTILKEFGSSNVLVVRG
jgi:ASC-1-like (ASCH) protein